MEKGCQEALAWKITYRPNSSVGRLSAISMAPVLTFRPVEVPDISSAEKSLRSCRCIVLLTPDIVTCKRVWYASFLLARQFSRMNPQEDDIHAQHRSLSEW